MLSHPGWSVATGSLLFPGPMQWQGFGSGTRFDLHLSGAFSGIVPAAGQIGTGLDTSAAHLGPGAECGKEVRPQKYRGTLAASMNGRSQPRLFQLGKMAPPLADQLDIVRSCGAREICNAPHPPR